MPKLVTQVSTTVIRDGKRVSPKLNAAFDYTQAEADYIRKVSGPLALRKPINESVEVDEGEEEAGTDEKGNKVTSAKGDKPSKGAKAKKVTKTEKESKPAEEPADDSDDDDSDDDEI